MLHGWRVCSGLAWTVVGYIVAGLDGWVYGMRGEIFAAAYGAAMARLLIDFTVKNEIEPTYDELEKMVQIATTIGKLAAEAAPDIVLVDDEPEPETSEVLN